MDRTAALEMLARTVHEAMRAYQAALAEPEAPAWPEAGWMQQASREAVAFALNKPTPGAQHDAWVRSKQREGWVYGSVKDETRKTHPSLVPFAELTESEQSKDALLIALVQAVAPIVGLSS